MASHLESGIDEEGEGSVPIEVYILRADVRVVRDTPPPSWMTSMIEYLKRGTVPEDREEERKLKKLGDEIHNEGIYLVAERILDTTPTMPKRGRSEERAP